jgi:hypothetical protein
MTKAIYPNSVICEKLGKASAIRDRITAMKYKRLQAAFAAAGFGDVNMCSLGNAFISYDEGKPWKEINYSKARLARRIANDYRASEIVTAYYHRMLGLTRAEG